MAALLFLLVVCLTGSLVQAKEEFEFSNCKDDAIVQLIDAEDALHPTGPMVAKEFKLNALFKSLKDVDDETAANIDVTIKSTMFVLGIWWPAPKFLFDRMAKTIENEDITYLGNGVFRHKCLFKSLFNKCLPAMGKSMSPMDFSKIVSDGMKAGGAMVPKYAWFRVHAVGKTQSGDTALCWDFKAKVQTR